MNEPNLTLPPRRKAEEGGHGHNGQAGAPPDPGSGYVNLTHDIPQAAQLKAPRQQDRKVVVYTAKCRNTCGQRIEIISAAFDETIVVWKRHKIEEILDKLFRRHGYILLEICTERTMSIAPAACEHSEIRKRKCDWCPLHMPGAPPLLCTLRDCREYEHGCYAIRNFDLR